MIPYTGRYIYPSISPIIQRSPCISREVSNFENRNNREDEYRKDPRIVQLILDQTKYIIRMNDGIIIVETYNGLVCANAGVDESNGAGYFILWPKDPQKSAKKIWQFFKKKFG